MVKFGCFFCQGSVSNILVLKKMDDSRKCKIWGKSVSLELKLCADNILEYLKMFSRSGLKIRNINRLLWSTQMWRQ